MYLETFRLPTEETEEKLLAAQMVRNGGRAFGYLDNPYPCGIFTRNGLREVNFDRITIFYGGNGSGKSTLLNLIACRLRLERSAPFNTGEMFDSYAGACTCVTGTDAENGGGTAAADAGTGRTAAARKDSGRNTAADAGSPTGVPTGSRIITSDDIFDYMLAARTNNEEIREMKEPAKEDWALLKYGESIRFRGMEDYDDLRLQLLARRKSVSRRQFLQKTIGKEVRLNSNGETAMRYFEEKLKNDTLYCLDEPENSMSPRLQQELVKLIGTMARYCGCQFVIATHSPFLLAMNGARIYDLDADPVDIKNWWELENVREYYAFFREHRNLFEKE